MAGSHARALVVFDLDGTLLRGPTVCEVLAQALDRLPRMQEIERLTERKDITAAREEMASWYRTVPSAMLTDALRGVQSAPGLMEGITMLQRYNVAIGIASITWRFAVEHFAAQLGIEHCLATTLEESGNIEHVWGESKREWLIGLSRRLKIPPTRVAAVGDSAGDYEMLSAADISIFVGQKLQPSRDKWLHWPGANIERIADHVVGAWQLRSQL